MTAEEFFDKWRDGPMDTTVNRELRADIDALLVTERGELLLALRAMVDESAPPLDFCENCGCIGPDAPCSYHVAEATARAAIAKAESVTPSNSPHEEEK